MLVIWSKGYRSETLVQSTWYVGDTKPDIYTCNNIEIIQADGHELNHIQNQYANTGAYNIPMPSNTQVIAWYGDIAKTIIRNL